MRKIIITVIIMSVMISNVYSQGAERKIAFYANSGISGPLGPQGFKDGWGAGVTFGFAAGYKTTSKLILGIYADFNSFNFRDEKLINDAGLQGYGIGIEGGKSRITSYGFNARYYLDARKKEARPYLVFNIGGINLTGSDIYVSYAGNTFLLAEWVGNETAMAVALGAGLEVYLSPKISLFADAKFSLAYTDEENTKYLPVRIGLSFY
ncbi:MAG: outer membrane beta-barrel protein [candidate division Zixibacteria bacterium]